MTSKRNFVPVNQGAIESSNAVSFGSYRQNSTWKSTGQPSDHLIELNDQGQLTFNGAPTASMDLPIPEWKESFRMYVEGEIRPIRGFVYPRIDIYGTTLLQPYFNNSTLIGMSTTTVLNIDVTPTIPNGFYCYLTAESGITFKIKPLNATIIHAWKTTLFNETYTSSSSNIPYIQEYSIPLLIKIDELHWSIAYWTIREISA